MKNKDKAFMKTKNKYNSLPVTYDIAQHLKSYVIFPDLSIDALGRACGDQVQIDFSKNLERIEIYAISNGCELSRKSLKILLSEIQNEKVDKALEKINQYISFFSNNLHEDNESVMEVEIIKKQAWKENRLNCLLLPWELASHALTMQTNKIKLSVDDNKAFSALNCDACVVSQRVEWLGEKQSSSNHVQKVSWLRQFISFIRSVQDDTHDLNSRYNDNFTELQRIGKLHLLPDDKQFLMRLAKSEKENEINDLIKLKIINILMENLNTQSIYDISTCLQKKSQQRKYRLKTIRWESRRINKILQKHNIEFTPIKGMITSGLYNDPYLRDFNDLDYLTPSLDSAAYSAHVLSMNLDYKLPLSGIQPFSLKVIVDKNGNEILTGHFHLVKNMGKHQCIVDVGFPNIPLTRFDTLLFPELINNRIRLEEQFIITLTHCFKHEIGFIKDVNDLFLLMKNELDSNIVRMLLEKYSLFFLARLIVHFILSGYPLSCENSTVRMILDNESLLQRFLIYLILCAGWPYSIKSHVLAKTIDLIQRMIGKAGIFNGIKKTCQVILTDEKQNNSEQPRGDMCKLFNISHGERLFLVPIFFFKEWINVMKLNLNELENDKIQMSYIGDQNAAIFQKGNISVLMLGSGIFFPTKNWKSESTREELKEFIITILQHCKNPPESLIQVRTI